MQLQMNKGVYQVLLSVNRAIYTHDSNPMIGL